MLLKSDPNANVWNTFRRAVADCFENNVFRAAHSVTMAEIALTAASAGIMDLGP